MPLAQTILRRVRARGRGAVFTAKDFDDVGSRAAVDQALGRLARAHTIRRVARGVYDLPRVHPRIGDIAPSPVDVAHAIARQTGKHLQPAGAAAANSLGLSTQVPAQSAWLTDGPSRTVQVGRLPVVLRHADASTMPCLGTPAGMAIVALRYLGPDNVSASTLDRLALVLSDTDKRRLRRARPQLPGWIGRAVDQFAAG